MPVTQQRENKDMLGTSKKRQRLRQQGHRLSSVRYTPYVQDTPKPTDRIDFLSSATALRFRVWPALSIQAL